MAEAKTENLEFSSRNNFTCKSLITRQQNKEDKRSEEQIRSGTKIEEDKNDFSKGNFDGSSEEKKSKENLQDKIAEGENIGSKKIFLPVSPSLANIIRTVPDIFKKLHSALKANANHNVQLKSFEANPISYLDDKDLKAINHNSYEQSLLKANVKEWERLIEFLQKEFSCVIFSDADYSVTHMCVIKSQTQHISSEISKFLNKNTNCIKISHHVRDFVKLNEKFSDLKPEVTSQDEIWIQQLKTPRLEELKKELENVVCQSFLIDESQYEILNETQNELLSDIENKFQVKGSLYHLPLVGEIPMVLQVNLITSISCLKFDPENIPVDCFICIHLNAPKEGKKKENMLLDLPRNYHNMSIHKDFIKNLTSIFKDNIFSHTIGISILPETSQYLKKICELILKAVENLPNRKRPVCILLLVETSEMQQEIIKILKMPVKLNTQSLPKPEKEECKVEIIRGLIAEQKVDVIVNSTFANLELKSGAVSTSILNKASIALQKECKKKYPNGIKFPDIAVTGGFNLPCKFVYHGCLPTKDGNPNIQTFVENCLNTAVKDNLTSIAFPVLGTGNLMYDPKDAAQQILSAIENFKQKASNISLKKITIVVYLHDQEVYQCFQSAAATRKGAVPKSNPASSLQNEQKQAVNFTHKQLQWVQFFNYSIKREPFESAIMEFERKLNSVTLSVSFDEAQELFFFYDLVPLVPDIAEQLDFMKDKLLVPKGSVDQLEKYRTELKKYHTLEFIIQSDMKLIHVDKFLSKIQQQYPRVKWDIVSSGQVVLFKASDVNDCKNAISQLEYYFGLKENISSSQGQSSTNKENPSESDKSNTAASSTKKYEDICRFQMKHGFLVKVYQVDILNADADGIVNFTDIWFTHSTEFAKQIIDAAGDDVFKEGLNKLGNGTLKLGEVISTSAGNLKRYKNIIHVVDPVYTKFDHPKEYITEIVMKSLNMATKLGLSSIALQATDIFQVSLGLCLESYLMGIERFINRKYPVRKIQELHIVAINPTTCKEIKDYFAIKMQEVPMEKSENKINQRKKNSPDPGKSGDM